MIKRLQVISLACVVVLSGACDRTEELPATPELPQPSNPAEQPAEPAIDQAETEQPRPLDLTPPDTLELDKAGVQTESPSRDGDFDAAPLFDPEEKPSRVSGMITPNITNSEDEDELLEIDGGEARIEIKTE